MSRARAGEVPAEEIIEAMMNLQHAAQNLSVDASAHPRRPNQVTGSHVSVVGTELLPDRGGPVGDRDVEAEENYGAGESADRRPVGQRIQDLIGPIVPARSDFMGADVSDVPVGAAAAISDGGGGGSAPSGAVDAIGTSAAAADAAGTGDAATRNDGGGVGASTQSGDGGGGTRGRGGRGRGRGRGGGRGRGRGRGGRGGRGRGVGGHGEFDEDGRPVGTENPSIFLKARLEDLLGTVDVTDVNARKVTVKVGKSKKTYIVSAIGDWGEKQAPKREVGRRGAVTFGTYVHPSMHLDEADDTIKEKLKEFVGNRADIRRAVIVQELQPINVGHYRHIHFVLEFDDFVALPWVVGMLCKEVASNVDVQLMVEIVYTGSLGRHGFEGMMAYCIKSESDCMQYCLDVVFDAYMFAINIQLA